MNNAFSLQELSLLAIRAMSPEDRPSHKVTKPCFTEPGARILHMHGEKNWDHEALFPIQNGKGIPESPSHSKAPNMDDLPQWTKTFQDCLSNVHDRNLSSARKKRPVPFEEVLMPFVVTARSKLSPQVRSSHLFSPNAHDMLETGLLQWLSHLSGPALEMEFHAFRCGQGTSLTRFLNPRSRRCYLRFIDKLGAGHIRTFFREFPVLARLLATTIDSWVETVSELISRLSADMALIQDHFSCAPGIVTSIQSFFADRHRYGRSVVILEFDSGLRLVYKPRDLHLEEAFARLLSWFGKHEGPYGLLAPTHLVRNGYGWVSFIEHKPCENQEEMALFYRRAGVLLCLTHLLLATDLHSENLIAHGAQPVLIDAETLFHPHEELLACKSRTSSSPVWQHMIHSVQRSGLLPRWQFDTRFRHYDFTGLGCAEPRNTPGLVRSWKHINTDHMRSCFENARARQRFNYPTLKGTSPQLQDHGEDLVAGFRATYRFLLKHRSTILAENGPLKYFSGCRSRFVLRPTRLYAGLIQKTLAPTYLRNGEQRRHAFEILAAALNDLESETHRAAISASEYSALERIDIPVFDIISDRNSLYLDNGSDLPAFFERSTYQQIARRFEQLNDNDMEDQIHIIRGSVMARCGHSLLESGDRGSRNHALDAASLNASVMDMVLNLAAQLKKRSLTTDTGSVNWIAPQPINQSGCIQMEPLGYGLYNGIAGVALFLAAVEHVSGGAGFRSLALNALETAVSITENDESIKLGAATGLGSLIYTLVRSSELLSEPLLTEKALRVADRLSYGEIDGNAEIDLLSGVAGAIPGLLALYEVSAQPELLNKAVACGRRLISERTRDTSGFLVWTGSNQQPATGFSHGASGMAHALLRLFLTTGKVEFRIAAEEALDYEHHWLFTLEDRNAQLHDNPTVRDPRRRCSWCNGVAGIGLARISALSILEEPRLHADLEEAIAVTTRMTPSKIDHVCCGNMGRAAFLTAAGKFTNREQIRRRHGRSLSDCLAHWSNSRQAPTRLCTGAGFSSRLLRNRIRTPTPHSP